jgi:alkylated DNA repair protein (DNA oxidative demethylase)
MTAPAASLPPGLSLAYEIMTSEEESALIALFEECSLATNAYDPGNPRSSISFGWKYDFQNDSFIPCAPIPEGLRAVCETAARLAGVDPDAFAECLVNRYEAGAIIQPHRDKPVWELVIGISLGSAAMMRFSKPPELGGASLDIMIPPRSLYLMSGEARHVYQHSLPPVQATRWSITLRTFSEEGFRLRDRYAA